MGPEQRPIRVGGKRRIETQIHRRKKAKAVYPLEAEWDQSDPGPPERLRTPASQMNKGK